MSKVKKRWIIGIFILALLVISGIYLSKVNIPVLEPKGPIADQEFRLLLEVTGLMLIVVVPVFILLGYIVYRYNDKNKKKRPYSPNWDHNLLIEGIWWFIPTALIVVLAIITWRATYALNPYKPIASNNKPIVIQVVSMDWKWLFIYPQYNIASVNKIVFPINTPVHFYITSNAPMNSLWIPQLSGQIYAMAGMRTQLYIMANQIGNYRGSSANISGIGFAGMIFDAQATTNNDFNAWIKKVSYAPPLNQASYLQLSKPSLYVKPKYYSRPVHNLFNDIILGYLIPKSEQKKIGLGWLN